MKIERHRVVYSPQYLLLLIAVILSLFLLMVGATKAKAQGTPPRISYAKSGDHSLIFVNNPERLLKQGDERLATGDKGDFAEDKQSIFTASVSGKYRDFFEHFNKTYVRIGYGIQLYNSGSSPVSVIVERSGFALDSHTSGSGNTYPAKPWADLLNQAPATTAQTIAPGATFWLLQEDTLHDTVNGTPTGIPPGLFTGVVDFIVSGPVTINHLAYTHSNRIPAPNTLTYEGYNTRTTGGGVPESRTYKGIARGTTDVVAQNVNFTVTNGDTNGPLYVLYPEYTKGTNGTYAPSTIVRQAASWITHRGPGQDAGSQTPLYPVSSDMVSFVMPPPENRTINPYTPSSIEGGYPNLANWGVVYTVSGTIKNESSTACSIYYRLANAGTQGEVVAYKNGTGTWVTTRLGASKNLRAINLAPFSMVSYSYSFVLGGPSGSPIEQTMYLLNS